MTKLILPFKIFFSVIMFFAIYLPKICVKSFFDKPTRESVKDYLELIQGFVVSITVLVGILTSIFTIFQETNNITTTDNTGWLYAGKLWSFHSNFSNTSSGPSISPFSLDSMDFVTIRNFDLNLRASPRSAWLELTGGHASKEGIVKKGKTVCVLEKSTNLFLSTWVYVNINTDKRSCSISENKSKQQSNP